MKTRISPRLTLVIIAAMFLLPLLLAWFMHSGAIEYKPASTRNFGQLVEPPVPTAWKDIVLMPGPDETLSGPVEAFRDHWVILFALPDPCLESCLEEIYGLRQIHRASGRHQARIRIALLMRQPDRPELENSLRDIYSKLHLISDPSGKLGTALEQAAAGQQGAYLIDPLANIMMFYRTGADPNHLKQDLKRLLTWSKLDEQ